MDHLTDPRSLFGNAKLADYLDEVPHSAAVCDPDGTLIFVNRAWTRFAEENGYRGPDFVGMNYATVCNQADGAEEDHGQTVARGLDSLSNARSGTFEHVYPCHSPDKKRWFKLIASRTGGGTIVSHQPVVFSHLDVTNEIETITVQSHAMVEAKLAHDIKTGLNASLGFLQLGRSMLADNPANNAADQRLAEAEKAGWRLVRLLDGVGRRARLAADGEHTEDGIDLVAEIESNAEILAASRPDVTYALTNRLPDKTKLRGDEDVIHRIILNLLSNAFKYSNPEGHVWVETRLNASNGIVASVTDNGLGISKDGLDQIFEAFEREERSIPHANGDGIGLASASLMAKALDAKISVDSMIGRGSTFTVSFPAWRTLI